VTSMTQGDLKPDLVVALSDEDEHGNQLTVDLTRATTVTVVAYRDGTEVFRRPAASVTAQGIVVLAWEAGDTATAGVIDVEVEVGWPDGPQTFTISGAVDIEAPTARRQMLVRVEELSNHMSGVTFTAAQTADAERTLAGLQRSLERKLKRRFTEAEVTEWTYADEGGWAMLTRTPVVSIESIGGYWSTGAAPFTYGRRHTKNGVAGLSPLSWALVTYRGGGLGDDLEDIRFAILEKAAAVMTNRHDDTRSVKDLDTREPTTRPPSTTWTDAELHEYGIENLRRIVVI
jgi:hypothetical protein